MKQSSKYNCDSAATRGGLALAARFTTSSTKLSNKLSKTRKTLLTKGRSFAAIAMLTLGLLASQQAATAKMQRNEWRDLGNYQVWNWADGSFQGTGGDWAWGGDINWYWFSWDQTAGDNLQVVSRGYCNYGASPGYGTKRVDNLANSLYISTNGSAQNVSGDYTFGVYGWLTAQPNNSSRGSGDVEFYISLKYSGSAAPGSSMRYLGSVNSNGVTYKCYENIISWGSFRQFRAFAQSQSWSGIVDVQPIFRLWRSNGMPNGVLDEMGWQVENYGTAKGELQLTGISIPTP